MNAPDAPSTCTGTSRPGVGLELVQRGADLRHRLVAAVERRAEDGDDADRVLVTLLDRLLRVEVEPVALHRHEAHLDVPVAAELLPAHLHVDAHDHVGLVGRLPGRLRAARQRHLSAMPPSIAASLEPVVDVPVASSSSGEFHNRDSMFTQRISRSAVRGYSSLSIMFLSNVSAMSARACGSIHVVTNVARLRRALPSSISSSCTTWYATSGSSSPSGERVAGGVRPLPPRCEYSGLSSIGVLVGRLAGASSA